MFLPSRHFFFRPLVGNLLDRKGRKVLLVIGVSIFTLVSLLYNFAHFVWPLILLRLVHGIGFSAYSTSTGTMVSDVVPTSRLMEGIGYYGVVSTLAAAVGPALGLFMIAHFGYNQLFSLTFLICVFGLLVAMFINYEEKNKQRTKELNLQLTLYPEVETGEDKRKKIVFFEKTALKPSAVMFFTALAQSAVISFLPAYALTRGINNIGVFFTVYAVALMISRPITGRLSDRLGATVIIVPGMVLLIIAYLAIANTSSLSFFIFIGIIYGLGCGAVFPVLNAITIKLCPASRRGSGNATFLSAVDGGYGIGSILWGVVSQSTGYPAIFMAAAGSVVISLFLFMFTLRKQIIQPIKHGSLNDNSNG